MRIKNRVGQGGVCQRLCVSVCVKVNRGVTAAGLVPSLPPLLARVPAEGRHSRSILNVSSVPVPLVRLFLFISRKSVCFLQVFVTPPPFFPTVRRIVLLPCMKCAVQIKFDLI